MEDNRYLSAIISAMSEQAGPSGSIPRTDPGAGYFPIPEARACPVVPRRAGHKQFSIAPRRVPGRGEAPDIEVMETGLPPEHVQVSMNIPVISG
jgi:hypothetical protein